MVEPTPLKKYDRQNGFIFPNFRGETTNYRSLIIPKGPPRFEGLSVSFPRWLKHRSEKFHRGTSFLHLQGVLLDELEQKDGRIDLGGGFFEKNKVGRKNTSSNITTLYIVIHGFMDGRLMVEFPILGAVVYRIHITLPETNGWNPKKEV